MTFRGTPEYRSWSAMRNRCNNPRGESFANYGGRGITVCKRWNSFAAFLADMGPRPPGTMIERKNNSKGYTKSNCCWATKTEQSRNRRSCHYATINGVRKTRSEWCRELGINERTVRNRVTREGMSLVKALTTPLRRLS